MSYNIFHLVHLFGLFALTGVTVAACFYSQHATRKKVLMWAGISSLVVFLAGFGLLGIQKIGFPGWIIVKLICWLGLSAIAGISFRKPEKANLLCAISFLLILIALSMVEFRPF